MFSVISRRLASQLGLMPIDKGFAHTVQGTYEPSVYLLDVMLPNGMVVKNRHVSDGDFDDCDVLIRSGRLSTGQPGVRDVRGAQANPHCVRESAYDASCETSPKLNLKTAVGGEFFSRRGAERQRMLRKLQICSFIAVTRTICCFTL